MDPTTFYHLGQIRHQEIVREAENSRHAKSLRPQPTLWRRFLARATAVEAPVPQACEQVRRRDMLAHSR